ILLRQTKNKKQRLPHMPARLLITLANLPRDKKPFPYSETQMRRLWDEAIAKAAEAVPSFVRLTCHCCRHGFATKLLRDGVDPKTAAALGGWDSVSLFLETYAHAKENARLTDKLFDTELTQPKTASNKNKDLV